MDGTQLGTRVDDINIAFSVLEWHKHGSEGAHLATLESANPTVRNAFLQSMNDHLEQHYELFQLLRQRGWYEVHPADAQQHQQLLQKFRNWPGIQAQAGVAAGAWAGVGATGYQAGQPGWQTGASGWPTGATGHETGTTGHQAGGTTGWGAQDADRGRETQYWNR